MKVLKSTLKGTTPENHRKGIILKFLSDIFKTLIFERIPSDVLDFLDKYPEKVDKTYIREVQFSGFVKTGLLSVTLPEPIIVPRKIFGYSCIFIKREEIRDPELVLKIETCLRSLIDTNDLPKESLEDLVDGDIRRFHLEVPVPYLDAWDEVEIPRRGDREAVAKALLLGLKDKLDSALKRVPIR